eukprot:CAMPEP_0113317684 /NCGR_PEP_ID=MMETSP0010_2-20120614/12490_1 /TAXON_ID=216773 ORGANISM="Corethron hystrix, Strain 308" /NCGR_SAMPLE_ID=MMETSP0010_2 /ASSEMBLY_ACC=CAM_ASM_000155 /LENGTH=575 /DNA_ID=CAMNT_0000174707 /DNA_START=269 /DNA_END=1996 /DNA_ORIENTATION=- /assembly_acc=CAM_ASM_000155
MASGEVAGMCLRPSVTRVQREMNHKDGHEGAHGEPITETVTRSGPVDSDIAAPHPTAYDYDFYSKQILGQIDLEIYRLEGKIANSLGFLWAKSIIEADYLHIVGIGEDPNSLVSHLVMVLEAARYQTTVDDAALMLDPNVKTLLKAGDFVSFYQTCGPSYIRSIRRQSEMMGVFTHETKCSSGPCTYFDEKTDPEGTERRRKLREMELKRMNSNLEKAFEDKMSEAQEGTVPDDEANLGGGLNHRELEDSITQLGSGSKYAGHLDSPNTHIELRAFGVSAAPGTTEDEALAVQVKTLEEFWKATGYFFRTLQSTHLDAGVPVSLEIVPWHKSPLFQAESGYLNDMDVEACAAGSEGGDNCPTEVGRYPHHLKQYNMMLNAEHLSRMDDVLKRKMKDMLLMQSCMADLHKFDSDTYDTLLLNQRYITLPENKEQRRRLHDSEVDLEVRTMSAARMRDHIFTHDVLDDFINELKDYIEDYYSPCSTALAQDSGYVHGGSIMTHAWYQHDECMDTVCIMPGAVRSADKSKCIILEKELGGTASQKPLDYNLLMKMYCSPTLTGAYGPPLSYTLHPSDH